ncbi:MAG: metallophosphoesterase [Steroidobacteraceae bacterium]
MGSRILASWLYALWLVSASVAADADRVYSWERVERVVAFGDVHGAYPELISLLQTAGVIDENLRWKAGATHLVSLGDLLDRGPASRQVMDLLMRLEQEAQSAGGRVHVVLGNHELMNLTGELSYVSPAEFASYQDLESENVRREALQALQGAGRFTGESAEQGGIEFDARFPRGYFGHRKAFSPDGPYGKWLLDRPALIRIGDVVFMHGGLPPLLTNTTLTSINETLRADVATYVRALHTLRQARLVDIDTPFPERVALARQRLAGAPASPQSDELARTIEELERTSASPVHDPRGPLWYRGTALCNSLYETDIARAALQSLQAREVVIGHTVTPSLRVTTRLDGRATMLDTGMLKMVYRGRPAALVLERESRKVIYAGTTSATEQKPQPERRRVGARPLNMDDDALAAFLARAEMIGSEPLAPAEARGPLLLTLRENDVTVRAVFRSGRASGWEREVAAYRLDKLIGLDMIPATVAREHGGQRGALQFRVEGSESLETLEKRQARFGGWCPLDAQYTLMAAFDAVIDNPGRTAANIWLSPDEWLVRLTAHSATFSNSRKLGTRANGLVLPNELVLRLGALTREQLVKELGQWLRRGEIDALLARRDELLRVRAKQ